MRQHQAQLAELGDFRVLTGRHACARGARFATAEQDGRSRLARNLYRKRAAQCALRRRHHHLLLRPSPVIIPLGSELVVASRTVLDGGGTVTLDGQHRTRIIRNNSQLTLKEIALTRGRKDVVWSGSPNGGGAVNTTYGHRLYVVDSTFTNNQTSAQGFGGAIFQAGAGALTVLGSRFASNVGGGGGAIYSLLAGLRVVGRRSCGTRAPAAGRAAAAS